MKQYIRVRQQVLQNVELGEQFRDIQRAFDAIPIFLQRTIEMMYTEPLVLGNLQQEPDAILCIRVIDLASQETTVLGAGGVCHYVWRADAGGAHINSINGMSLVSNGGKKYRLTFLLVYAPVGGPNA